MTLGTFLTTGILQEIDYAEFDQNVENDPESATVNCRKVNALKSLMLPNFKLIISLSFASINIQTDGQLLMYKFNPHKKTLSK